jgi:hypothetical protein
MPSHGQYTTILDKIRTRDYDFYYISVGAAIMEKTVSIYGKNVATNSKLQICPNFLNNKNVLNIMIDQTISQETKEFILGKNIHALQMEISPQHVQWENSDFYVFFQNLIHVLNEKRVPLKKVIIVNYIKFKHYHISDEERIQKEDFYSEKIFHALSYPTTSQQQGQQMRRLFGEYNIHYSKCLYEWFGYNKIYYNCIHKYCFYNNQTNRYENFDKKYKGFINSDFVFSSFLGTRHNQYDKRNSQFLEKFVGTKWLKKQFINLYYEIMLKNTFSLLNPNFESVFTSFYK